MDSEQIDFLTCGGCLKKFELAKINNFVRHKRFDCDEQNTQQGRRSKVLICKSCPQKFGTPWSLLQHAQNVHALQIYLEQGDFSEVTLQPAPSASVKENLPAPAQFTTHQALTFAAKDRLPGELNASATPVMIIQGANGEQQLVRIEKPRSEIAKLPPEQVPVNGGSLRVAVTNPQMKSPGVSKISTSSIIQTTSKAPAIMSPPKIKVTQSQPFKATPVLQQQKAGKVGKGQPTQGFFMVPAQNKPAEKAAAAAMAIVSQASTIVQKAVNLEPRQVEPNQDSTSPAKSPAREAEEDPSSKENKQEQEAPKPKAKEDGTKEDAAEEDAQLCCDNQDCGVTVMPVTHKELEKCCSAILPKKRKRHMAINHMPNTLRAKRRGEGYSVNVPSADRSFFIDIEHHNGDASRSAEENSVGADEYKQLFTISEPTSMNHEAASSSSTSSPQERSVIIQPGSSIAIPVSLESFRRLVGSKKRGRIPVRFPGSSPMPISMHVAPINEEKNTLTERDVKPVISADGQIQMSEESGEEKQIRRGKRRYPTSRPFKCNECEQGFNQRIHLQKHQSKHTGIKPFQCGQCSYSTVEKSHLKVHIRVHTGEKPFKCTYCEYATAQNSTLKIHLRRHHDLNPGTAPPDPNPGTVPPAPGTAGALIPSASGASGLALDVEGLRREEEGEGGSEEEEGAMEVSGQGDVVVEQVYAANLSQLLQVDRHGTEPRAEPRHDRAQGAIMEQDNEDVMTAAQAKTSSDHDYAVS